MQIRLLELCDADKFSNHYVTVLNQSGIEGRPVYNFFEPGTFELTASAKANFIERIKSDLTSLSWEKVFVCAKKDVIRGHLSLRGSKVPQSSHRVLLMMAIENGFTGQGLGSQLLEHAISWCTSNSLIDWIDLGVFAQNEPAIALYKKFGFEKISLKRDAFRVERESIDVVDMTYKIARNQR